MFFPIQKHETFFADTVALILDRSKQTEKGLSRFAPVALLIPSLSILLYWNDSFLG
ncbi:MAG: hypothetical protein HYZ54_03990 [Ignavibacteriae bacterium]|nr:hypothetical protein [Ignavibacteriota bacterium]